MVACYFNRKELAQRIEFKAKGLNEIRTKAPNFSFIKTDKSWRIKRLKNFTLWCVILSSESNLAKFPNIMHIINPYIIVRATYVTAWLPNYTNMTWINGKFNS